MRCALITGGTGAVGSALVRALCARDVDVHFTYHSQADAAAQLAEETGANAHALDLNDATATAALARALDPAPDLFIHAAVVPGPVALSDAHDDAIAQLFAVNCLAPLRLVRELSGGLRAGARGDVVLLGALGPAQPARAPVAFAATQGALHAMARALAHELGPSVRANYVVLGLLGGDGVGLSALGDEVEADYLRFSALRRKGSAEEVARAICWLALESSYLSGQVIPINGGI